MFYCQNILSLSLFNDINLYTKYVEYLRDICKLRLSSMIVKYTKKIHDPSVDVERMQKFKLIAVLGLSFQSKVTFVTCV